MNYKISGFLLICLLFTELLNGQSCTETRSYKNTVNVSRNTTLEIVNKYGNIHISSWDKNYVSIDAEVEATTTNLKRLHNILDGIEINVSETDRLLSIKTEFMQNINFFLETIKGMTDRLIPYESRIKINYNIYAPDYLDMRINNKYGDVFIDNNTSVFFIDLENGSFKANKLKKAEKIELSFCDATINSLESATINASFSEIEIKESGDLNISSVSSRFELKNTGVLNIKSRRDKLFAGRINSIKGDSYFSNMSIDILEKEIGLETRYGSFNAGHIEKTFEKINLESGFTDINLVFERSASYNLDIKHLNSSLVLPEQNSDLTRKDPEDEQGKALVYGSVGNNPGNTHVTIDATKGNIYLKQEL